MANGGEANGCGNEFGSLTFFISFMILVTFIFLNLFVAIIVQGFEEQNESNSVRVDNEQIDIFRKAW